MDALKLIAQDSLKADVSEAIKVGNTIKIWVKIREGERERLQAFEGTVIATDTVLVLGAEERMGEEAEDAEAVVDGNKDDSSFCPGFAVHFRLEAPAGSVTAAVNPHCNRQLGVSLAKGLGRSPNIEVEAVLAELRISVEEEFRGINLLWPMLVLH